MAVIVVAHKPDLTKEQAEEVFRGHFAAKYTVEKFKGPLRDFTVVKNPFVGVALKLQQTGNETKFTYAGLCPRWWARALLGPLFGIFLWSPLTKEVENVIRTAPEFN